jgi:hypothetical protein
MSSIAPARGTLASEAALAAALQPPMRCVEDAMKRGFVLLIAAGMVTGMTIVRTEDVVAIRVRPAVATCGSEAQLKIFVARDEKNRQLVWEIDGPGYYRSSVMELHGASAPRTHFFRLRDLPSGEFEVRATIIRNDRSRAVVRTEIRVVGGPD